MPGQISPPPTSKETASLRFRHASRHVRHARAVMHVGIANPRWREKHSRHSRPMRNPQFYVSVKRPMAKDASKVSLRSSEWCEGLITLCVYVGMVPVMLTLGQRLYINTLNCSMSAGPRQNINSMPNPAALRNSNGSQRSKKTSVVFECYQTNLCYWATHIHRLITSFVLKSWLTSNGFDGDFS